MIVFWNVASSLQRVRKADVFIISVAKSGRTWLRVLINRYYTLKHGKNFDLYFTGKEVGDTPNIFFTHEQWEHETKATPWQKVRGKYRIPSWYLEKSKVILLYRDPRDITISLYHHKTKRSSKLVKTTKSEFLRHSKFGIVNTVKILNQWHDRLRCHPHCLWLCYEKLRSSTESEFLRVMQFLENGSVNMEFLRQAIEFSDFQNMQKMERERAFNDSILSPKNPEDPDSYKVRKGKVGGYVEELEHEDVVFVNDAVKDLDPHFGFK